MNMRPSATQSMHDEIVFVPNRIKFVYIRIIAFENSENQQ